MGEAARIWTTVGANIAPLKAGLAEAGAATDKFGRSFGASFAAHTRTMEKFGRSWQRNVSLPLAATGAVAVKMSMDFQKNMALISTSAGATSKDVKLLTDQVLGLARSGSSPYGPNELAKALYHLKSLGYDNVTAMRTLKVSINGAMAGQSNLEATTSALGAAIRTNIKGTGDFSKAMATLNAIVGAGNMRMEDLIGALGTGILPAAKSAGLSLKDVGSALALMVDEGMSAESAATRLRMAFTMMSSGSKASNEALARIGLSTKQLGMMMQGPAGLIGGLQLLQQHLSKLGGGGQIKRWAAEVDRGKMSIEEFTKLATKTEQFDVISRAFGGARSGAAITMLLNNLDVLKQKFAQVGNTTDQFKRKVEEARRLDVNKLKESWAQVDAALIKAGAAITPFVTRAAKGLATLADWFSNLHKGTQKWLLLAAGALTMGGPLLVFTAKIITALKTIRGLFYAEAAASTAATTTVVAGQTAQDAAIISTQTQLTRLGLMFRRLAGLVIPVTIAYQVVKHGGLGGLGKWAAGYVHKGLDAIHAPKTIQHFFDPRYDDQGHYIGETNNATTGPAAQSAAGMDSPRIGARANIAAADVHRRAAAQERAMREALARQSKKHFDDLMKSVYGSTDYTPPNMDNIPGLNNGGKGKHHHKTHHGAAKPVTNPIVAAAAEYLGVPYVWGGSSPSGFDCSGFIMYLYKKFGIDLPHYTGAQIKVGKPVALPNIKAGDAIFTHPGKGGVPGHEGLYIGGGRVEEAPHTGDKVKIVSLKSFLTDGLVGIRRFANFSGVERGANGVGHFTNTTSYVKLADATKLKQTAAAFKLAMKEIAGLSGDAERTATAKMKMIGRALVQVVTPGDLSKVKSNLSEVQKTIKAATEAMQKVVESAKTKFASAWERLAGAGISALDKKLQAQLDAITKKYASGPKQEALKAMQNQHDQAARQQALDDAKKAYQQAVMIGDPTQILAAKQALADAQYAIDLDAAQKAADLEATENQKKADAETKAAQDSYDRIKQSFQDQVDAIKAGMEDGSIATSVGLAQISSLFTQFGIDLSSEGPVIGGTIYDTITAGLQGAKTAAEELATALRALNLLTNTPAPPPAATPGNPNTPGSGAWWSWNEHNGGGAAGGATSPTTGGSGGHPRIRPMAKGGIGRVNSPTLFLAGEAGSEDFAFSGGGKSFGGELGGGEGVIQLTVQSVLDGKVIAENTQTHLLRKKQRTGALGLA